MGAFIGGLLVGLIAGFILARKFPNLLRGSQIGTPGGGGGGAQPK